MAKTVSVTLHGMEGEGKNVTEAKQDAGRKIAAVLKGSYTPELLRHRGYAALLFREPAGWQYVLVADADTGAREGRLWGIGPYRDQEEVRKEALGDLAQLGWEPADGTETPAFLTEPSARADFKTWAEFQLRYREGVAKGLDYWDAHSYAGRDPSKPHLWREEQPVAPTT